MLLLSTRFLQTCKRKKFQFGSLLIFYSLNLKCCIIWNGITVCLYAIAKAHAYDLYIQLITIILEGYSEDADAYYCRIHVEIILPDNWNVLTYAVLCLRWCSHVWYDSIR